MHSSEPQPAETSLELPPSDPPPQPPSLPAEQPEEQPAPDPLADLVVAHFRRVEVAMLGRVLVTTLSGSLPPSMVRVERRRSFGRRSGPPIGVTITAGERQLAFRAPEVGVVETTVAHTVRGIVLSTTPVPLPQWLDELAVVLQSATRDDEAARVALEQALLR